jgi:hypothetical protein
MRASALVGGWRLVSYETRTAEGGVSYPLGRDATGLILYTPDGHMSVALMSANRTNYASGDMRGGTAEEKLAAAETYISYCGRYELKGDEVVHHVELAFFPNRVGTPQVRTCSISGDTLTLSTPPMLIEGKQQTGHLVWRRANAALPEGGP